MLKLYFNFILISATHIHDLYRQGKFSFLVVRFVLGSFLVQVFYLGGFEERSQICFLVSWDSHIIDRLGDSVLKMIGSCFLILKLTFFYILKLKFLKYLKLTSLEIDKAEIANSPWFEAEVGQRCLIG